MTPDDDQGAPPHWFAERATARYPNGWRYLCDDPEREHGYNPALGGIVHRDDYSACGWGLAPTALAPGEGDAKPGGNPAAPDDLQVQIAEAMRATREFRAGASFGVPPDAHDLMLAGLAAAVMDVLRQRGVVTK